MEGKRFPRQCLMQFNPSLNRLQSQKTWQQTRIVLLHKKTDLAVYAKPTNMHNTNNDLVTNVAADIRNTGKIVHTK